MSTTIKPRSAQVVIYQGDDLQQIAELRQDADVKQRIADEAARNTNRRAGDDETPVADAQAARDAYDAFVDEAAERAVVVELHALGRKQFQSLMLAHPPRKVPDDEGKQVTHDDDAPYEVNVETFAEPFLSFIDPKDGRRTIASPEFATQDECVAWLDDLSEGDFDKLFATAYLLNRMPGADPKASRFSSVRRSFDAT